MEKQIPIRINLAATKKTIRYWKLKARKGFSNVKIEKI